MPSMLAKIAFAGIGVGIVSLSLAWTIGGRDLRNVVHDTRWGRHFACTDSAVAASGPERRLAWTGDDTIDIAGPLPLRLVPGSGSDVVLRGAPEMIAHLQLNGRHLRADCRPPGNAATVTVELPARALRNVRLSGSATVTLEKLDQQALALTVSGSGQVQAQGTVEQVAATISGSGNVRLGEVVMRRLTTKISGSGSLEAGPRDEADIKISGSGDVRLLSRPAALTSKISGSGHITQPPVAAADRK
jgi:hypothetical protein